MDEVRRRRSGPTGPDDRAAEAGEPGRVDGDGAGGGAADQDIGGRADLADLPVVAGGPEPPAVPEPAAGPAAVSRVPGLPPVPEPPEPPELPEPAETPELPDLAAVADVAGLIGATGRGGGLTGRLERWAAEIRVEEAARRRSRERWLVQQAGEEGTFAGVLVDLAERGAAVVVHTSSGTRHAGQIVAIGADFVAVGRPGRPESLVRTTVVAAVRTQPGEPATLGDRVVDAELTLDEVLVRLAGERERVTLVLGAAGTAPGPTGAAWVAGAEGGVGAPGAPAVVSGTLRSVGEDVVTLRLDAARDAGRPPSTCYVPLRAIAEVRVDQ